MFDPNLFMDATTTEESVKRPPVPAGTDLIGEIKDIKPQLLQGKADPSKTYPKLNVQMQFQIPSDLQATLKLPPTVTYTDGILLDLTDSGALDMAPGKNARLGRYRMALDLNTPGQPFSPRMMIGKMIRGKVAHEVYEGEVRDSIGAVSKV
jgi:hypothetical protein